MKADDLLMTTTPLNENNNEVYRTEEQVKYTVSCAIHKLIIDANRYDDGDLLALFGDSAILRTLFYQSHSNIPLIDQLGIHGRLEMVSHSSFQGFGVDYGSMIFARFKEKTLHKGRLFNTFMYYPQSITKELPFDEWWKGTLFQLGGARITRKSLIKYSANQNGGAHFDKKLDKDFYDVLYGNTGFVLKINHSNYKLLGSSAKEIGQEISFQDLQTALLREVIDESIESLIKTLDFIDDRYVPNFNFNFHRKVNRLAGAPYVTKK